MENVGKLVDTINAAIQKAGGEAARVWPDMVASYALSAWLTAGGFGAFAVPLLVAAGWLGREAARYRPKHPGDAGRWDYFAPAIFLLILGLFALSICAFNLPHALYPEANLVKSLVR